MGGGLGPALLQLGRVQLVEAPALLDITQLAVVRHRNRRHDRGRDPGQGRSHDHDPQDHCGALRKVKTIGCWTVPMVLKRLPPRASQQV